MGWMIEVGWHEDKELSGMFVIALHYVRLPQKRHNAVTGIPELGHSRPNTLIGSPGYISWHYWLAGSRVRLIDTVHSNCWGLFGSIMILSWLDKLLFLGQKDKQQCHLLSVCSLPSQIPMSHGRAVLVSSSPLLVPSDRRHSRLPDLGVGLSQVRLPVCVPFPQVVLQGVSITQELQWPLEMDRQTQKYFPYKELIIICQEFLKVKLTLIGPSFFISETVSYTHLTLPTTPYV